jgi:hypothetical protein
MVKYKLLNTANECYDPMLITKMQLLYDGGYKIMANSKLFLNKLSIESNKSYTERLQCASYLPYLAQFVNHFGSSLFSDELRVKEAADADDDSTLGGSADDSFYKLFAANCDLKNTSLHNFMHDVFEEALYCPSAFVGVDFDRQIHPDNSPISLLEEELQGGSRAHLYCIDPKSVINWKKDEANNKYIWIVLKNEVVIQPDPLQPPNKQVEFKLWTMNGEFAHWALYQSKPIPLDRSFNDTMDIPLVDEGDTSFREIPVFELKVDDGLHVGSKLGPICEELFQRRSFLVSNMNKTCVAIPVIKLGPEIAGPGESMPSEAQQNPNRADAMRFQLANQGYTVLGADDDLEIKESTGASHELVDKQLNELIDKMHGLIHQMAQSVANNTKALGRSAASKGEDRHSTEVMLSAYSRMVKDFVKEIYLCIAGARGEDVLWVVDGLSTFVEEDRDVLMKEAELVAGKSPLLSMLPSPTLHKKYLLKLGMSLLGSCSEEEELAIQEELENGIESGQHMEQMLPPDPATNKPAGKSPAAPKAAAPADGSDPDMPLVGESGHMEGYEGEHLADSGHIDPQVVYDQLAREYDEKYLQFVKTIPWQGPRMVPLSSIDFSNMKNWEAYGRTDKIEHFKELMTAGDFSANPIILVNEISNNSKYVVLDGHTRALAALQLDQPVLAYIGQVGKVTPEMTAMHDDGEAGGNRVKSNQLEQSNQLEKSNQK